MRCNVIVLNLNGRELLNECLQSLMVQTFNNFEVTVVDNGSWDGSADLVAQRYPNVDVMALGQNLGFSKANNLALRRAVARGADYALLLNNDTSVARNFLEEMLIVAESDPRIGAVSPKIYFSARPEEFWYAGGDFNLWTARARHWGWNEVDRGQFDKQMDVALATGCAMLVRCTALADVGFLDEQLWAYLEDAEWSIRFLKRGYRLAFAPGAKVWHHDGATWVRQLGAGSGEKRQYLSSRNMVLLARKHLRWWQVPTYSLGLLVTHIAFYTALRVWRRDPKAVWAIYRGLWHGLLMSFGVESWRPDVKAPPTQ